MKVIDNFQKIGQALHFDSEDQFYFIQILQRKKDNPVFPQNNRLVKYYVVRSVDYFWHIEPEVKAICEATTARAYISLNRRSFKKCTLEALAEIATIVRSEQYLHLPSMFSSVVGRTAAERDKTWIIDIDTKDEGIRQEVRDFLPMIEPNPGLNKIWMEIETLHGVHLISTPFNQQKFKARFPDIDVHKDNPTLLYFKSLCLKNGKRYIEGGQDMTNVKAPSAGTVRSGWPIGLGEAVKEFASRGLAACEKAAGDAGDEELKAYHEGKAQAFKEILAFFEYE